MDNRILVAAARGARTEGTSNATWHEVDCIVIGIDPRIVEYRVHPDDTELLYCKVGRALREAAENPPALLTSAVGIDTPSSPLAQFNPYVTDWIGYRDADTETRRMFLLMLAEELSYEVLE